MSLKWTICHAALGRRVVHALIGGGDGIPGEYVSGQVWCGVHLRRPAPMLIDFRNEVTCKKCLECIAAFDRR